MYITRRMAQVAGLDGLDWGRRITEAVQAAGVDASFWVGGPGTVPGTVAWSVVVDDFADWFSRSERVLADPEYQRLAREGRDLIMAIEPDVTLEIVHGELGDRAEVGQFVGSVSATAHPDRGMAAMEFAVEIVDAWSNTTGHPAIVTTHAAGDMGAIEWLARYEDAARIDEANAKLATSETYAAVLTKGQGLFTTGRRTYARRMA